MFFDVFVRLSLPVFWTPFWRRSGHRRQHKMEMLILLVTVFCALWGPSATLNENDVCYGNDLKFPMHLQPNIQQGLYFTPRNGGKRKTLMENGKAQEPRLKVDRYNTRLTNLTKKDEGIYAVTYGSSIIDELQLKIKDCAEKIIKEYMHEWSYRVPTATHYVEYTSPHKEEETVILWNLNNPLSKPTRGDLKGNFWTISGVTQADNGYYNFRGKEGTLRRRVFLTVKENTRSYDAEVSENLIIMNPWSGGPWTVTFKKDLETSGQVTIIENGDLVNNGNRFSGRISIQSDGIKIRHVEAMDSGIFEFRDPQGNLALSAHVNVDGHVSHHLVTYVVVAVVAVVLGLCCCFCCRRKCCCKKNKSAATEGSAVTFHDKSDSAAPPPAVYYHGTSRPAGPSYPIQTSSGYTPYPANPPAYTQAVVSIEQPLQPNAAVYPPQPASAYPLQPASVNPPQPEPSLYPPLSEFGPPASQGSAAAPTFSSDAFSPDAEPRFELKGLAFPSAPPLSSDAPTCDVYNSDKLNFL
ncbi:uncharacterized protein LOC106946853 isoform X2 [Poecilia latipinna]|uniref:uncharacterized protein LOC106946853 isoform X2 n=1 Tax=Poecilia latipinna TaxID=48699 RepID=UPI00072DC648|nr:PREDICTED: uncharacterized protein LOC106946853 isoform X2 [Poecilia latipinna]